MKRYLLTYVFLLCFFLMKAQEEFIEPPSKLLTTVPFTQLTGGIVLLKANVNDIHDTLNFILDTGSAGISLDSTTASNLGLKSVPSDRTIRGIAGIRTVSFIYNGKLRLPHLEVDKMNFHINDYSILTSVYGEQIDGIIGYSFLSKFIIKLDYDSLKMYVYSKGTFKYPRGGYLFRPLINSIPVHTLRVKDEEAIQSRFLFDIGAGLCMMLSEDFVDDSMFIRKNRKRFVKEAEGLGGKIDIELTVIKEVKIGQYKFKKVPVNIFRDEYNITQYPFMGGLIGNDLLRRFNTILDYDKRTFHLAPNSHYLDPFDYTYTGLELYFENGEVILGDVAKDSPAEKAGLKEGDVVVAINNNFSHNLTQLKTTLQSATDKVKMIVKRDDDLKEFTFKIKSIL